MMKRFFSFLALAVFFTACDDGDLEEVSFEFDENSAKACNVSGLDRDFFIYKTTDQRAILLQTSEKNFANTVTADTLNGLPITFTLDGANKLIYRVYSGNISSDDICSAIPPSSPVVTEERIASGGKVQVTTEVIKTFDDANGSSKITDYRHTIRFSDVTFDIGDGSQRNETLPAIIYQRQARSFTAFDTASELNPCTDVNPTVLYKYTPTQNTTESQALSLRLTDASSAILFATDQLDVPKQQPITLPETEGGQANTLTHQFFSRTDITPLTNAYFCSTGEPPVNPAVKDTWRGAVGGIIEVVTTQIDGGYKHTVTLRNIKMEKNSNTLTQNFLLKSEFIFGSFEVEVP